MEKRNFHTENNNENVKRFISVLTTYSSDEETLGQLKQYTQSKVRLVDEAGPSNSHTVVTTTLTPYQMQRSAKVTPNTDLYSDVFIFALHLFCTNTLLATRVEKLRRNRSKNCRFWSTFVDFVGFLCRKCRLSTFLSVLSVLAVRSVDYCRFLSVLSVSICFKYKRNRVKQRDKWCSGGEGG